MPSVSALPPPSPLFSDHSRSGRRLRVSAEHTLNRVRENQRRHRARQKDHVASLELKLAETERQLADARAEIEALRAEKDTANAFACYDITKHFNVRGDELDSDITTTLSITSPLQPLSPEFLITPQSTTNALESTLVAKSLQLLQPVTPSLGPPPCCTDTLYPSISAAPLDPECSTCKTRPPPSPSESTTLCAQAFAMISQKNLRNLDPELIRMWLNEGYRRAVEEGEGCRVENGTLHGLLEYISGV